MTNKKRVNQRRYREEDKHKGKIQNEKQMRKLNKK